MPLDKLAGVLQRHVADLASRGTAKGEESVVIKVIPPRGERGPRFLLAGMGEQPFIRMNSNSYLGMSLREVIIHEEEQAAASFGAGPGAVSFISGTDGPHVALERRLAAVLLVAQPARQAVLRAAVRAAGQFRTHCRPAWRSAHSRSHTADVARQIDAISGPLMEGHVYEG